MNIYNNFVHRHVKPFGSRLDNTDIRLMGHEKVKLLALHSCALEGCLYRPAHNLCRKAENRLAVHMDEVEPLLNGLGRHGAKAAARRYVESVTTRAVTAEVKGTDAIPLLNRPKYGCTGTISEEDAGVSILPVNDLGENLSTDHEDTPIDAVLNKLCGNG